MTNHKSSGDREYSPKRRRLLQSIGAMGAIGALGTGTVVANGPPGGNGPPGQSCEECPPGMEFIAKYEFDCVEWDDDDNCIEWDFVFEKGEDIVDITYEFDDDTYNKGEEDDFEKAEPNYIEFGVDGWSVERVCAFGGNDTHEEEDEDGLTSFSSEPDYDNDDNGEYDEETGLVNPGGQEAAISNVVFCGEEITEVDFPETVSIAYEDLPPDGGNDYDYNDWVVDIEAVLTGTPTGDGKAEVTEIEMELLPQAAGGGDDHHWFVVPGAELGDEIEYELEVNGESSDGTVNGEEFFYDDIKDDLENGGIDDFKDELEDGDNAIHIFDSDDAFEEGEIVNSEPGDDCVESDIGATLTFELDEPWVVDTDTIGELGEHGAELFFNPVKVSKNTGQNRDRYPVSAGDFRLLTVPTDWPWPLEGVHIADAYDGVGPDQTGDGVVPEFDEDDWFENPIDGQVFDACRDD